MALTIQFKNNATGTLSAGIVAADLTIILTAGHGSYFPSLTGGQYFYGTLKDSSGNLEIVKVTARSTDTLTVQRSQEGTTAQATNAGGDTFELRPTAAGLNAIHTETLASAVASDGSTVMTGSLQMGAGTGIIFEGTTADNFETTLTGGEPTADRTISLADNAGVLDPLGYTTTATAAGTTTLTTASTTTQFFTGSSTQTVVLPVTSTLFTGKTYTIVNNSTGQVTVQSSGANNILVMGPQSTAVFTCILTSGTTAASWENVMLGYKNIPINSQSAAYTTVLSDAGKTILHPAADTTARTFTIDSNANVPYPIGTAITFVNETLGGIVTIAITSDTLLLAGAGTTGSRSLAASNIATAVKITTTKWIISGSSGLT